MRAIFRNFAGALAAVLALAASAHAKPVDTGHIEVELIAQEAGVVPGGTTYVAVRQKIDDGWHTYWRNAGDSGEAFDVDRVRRSGGLRECDMRAGQRGKRCRGNRDNLHLLKRSTFF